MLSRYRVLDFTRERNLICGQILSDLGAEIIHIELPTVSPERSFVWEAYAKNSKSVVVDFENLESTSDLKLLQKLIEGSRFKLSRTPAILERPAPMFGEHNFTILSEFLKYDDKKIAFLTKSGALAS